MRYSLTLILTASLALGCLVITTIAQTTGQRANEEAHKLTEKVKKKVATLGVGEIVNVDMHDGKRLTGKITRVDENSFEIQDRQNTSQISAINYSDVKSLGRWTHASNLTKGILIGVAAAAAVVVIIFAATLCHNEPGTC